MANKQVSNLTNAQLVAKIIESGGAPVGAVPADVLAALPQAQHPRECDCPRCCAADLRDCQPRKLSIKDTARLVRSHGMCCGFNTHTREFRISHPRVRGVTPEHIENTAHYTNDPEDAIRTARVMASPPTVVAGPALDSVADVEAAIAELVEPDGSRFTQYGVAIRAMADRLNCWEAMSGADHIQDLHDSLFDALRSIEGLACTLDEQVREYNK